MRWAPWAILAGVLAACIARTAGGNPPQPYAPPTATYSASFREPDPIQRDILATLKRSEAELRAIRLVLQAVKAEPAPVSLKALFALRCAECHKENTEAAKKNGVVLLLADGSLPPFSVLEKRAIARVIQANEMPKDRPPLSEVEKAFVTEQLAPK